ncbi:uncharacterized protein B0H18DRAFT_1018790 [Fomitopsis serialis]|uniref:uncharacterized protein n=1 Tax=Fomitopsis serialis TaxID=139415 RepID=UPI0020073BE7|nr:uncharacterized protein B0H18DRAFT_1018790 [Neoantrodia serialis]KAH9922259.1 hypothetical protein B0H18DRAFT_1018790 [Neoantrodia serialis]
MVLPAEIHDEIVDQLSGETGALKACALTCHQWARRAQSNLFRTITILTHVEHGRVLDMLEEHPRLGQLVRVLTFSKPKPDPASLDGAWPDLLLMMDRVEELNIGSVDLFTRGVRTYFSRIRILRLLGTHNFQCNDFLRLLAACRSLSELHLSDQIQITPPPDDGAMQPSGSVTSCLLYHFPLHMSLRRLQPIVNDVAPSCSNNDSDILRVAAPVLEELVLRLTFHGPLYVILQSPVPFLQLRRLHLKDAGLEAKFVAYEYPTWMLTALTHISRWEMRANLREIVLSLPMPGTSVGPFVRRDRDVEPPALSFPFPWVQLDITMAKLAQDNEKLAFTVNIRDPSCKKTQAVPLTDPSFGRYRLRESRMQEVRPQALTVLVGPHWNALRSFGGELSDRPFAF